MNDDLKKSFLADCSMTASDIKSNADYASYAFKQGNEAEGREYVARIEENLRRLKGHLSMLSR